MEAMQRIQGAAQAIQAACGGAEIGLILGSGLGDSLSPLEDARALCQRQLDFLNGNTAAQAAPASEEAVDAAVKSIEASVARIPDEPAPQIDISPVMGERAPRQTITPDDMTRLFNMGGS